jgi:hypothetical protein
MSQQQVTLPTIPYPTQDDEMPTAAETEVHSEEKPSKKRARKEPAEFAGTDAELEASWITLKSLFHQHPEAFNDWIGGFTDKMIKFEKRFSQPKEFFLKLSIKQKSCIYNNAKELDQKLQNAGKSVDVLAKGKRKQIQTLSEEDYDLAWKSLVHMANPLTSAVEFNYLSNIALRLREYKKKALLSVMELEFLKKISVSIPTRQENKSFVIEDAAISAPEDKKE